jgi:hypothetical protein
MKQLFVSLLLSSSLILIISSCSEDKWNEKTREDFIKECKKDLTEESCKCVLEKIEAKNYLPSDMYSSESDVKKGFEEAMQDCLGL